jgi:hypothetical protein
MKFESKAEMARKLMEGKVYISTAGAMIAYDETQTDPFRYSFTGASEALGTTWECFDQDIWTEANRSKQRPHQMLIDQYREGQAWQFAICTGKWEACWHPQKGWQEPNWSPQFEYKPHPHNDLLQKY